MFRDLTDKNRTRLRIQLWQGEIVPDVEIMLKKKLREKVIK